MSPALEVYLELDEYRGEGFGTFVLEAIVLGHKVSARQMNGGHTCVVSVTGGQDTKNQNLIMSAFGDNLDDCANKIEALWSLIDTEKQSWHFITEEIKRAEKAVAQILRDSR